MTDHQGIEMIAQALRAFIKAKTWAESKRIVEAQAGLLLTDKTDFVLTILLEQSADDQDVLRHLEDHRELLQRCRAEGIEAAFAERLRPATTPDIPQLRLAPLIEALIDCDNPSAVLTLVAEQPDLLSDEMDTLLQQFINHARAQGDAEGDGMAQHVEARHPTLRLLREMMRETGMSAEAVGQAVAAVQKMPADALQEAVLLQKIQ